MRDDDTKAERPGRGWALLDLQPMRNPPEWLAAIVYTVAIVLGLGLSLYLLVAALLLIVTAFLPAFTPTTLKSEDARNLIITVGAIVAAGFASWRLVLSHWNTRAAQQQARIAEQSHLTTLFTKAVEQLGAMREVKVTENVGSETSKQFETLIRTEVNIEVRLGAVFALGRIARDSRRDFQPIMETLCAYVRENGTAAKDIPENVAETINQNLHTKDLSDWLSLIERPRPDVHAAIGVISQQNDGDSTFRYDLTNACLQRGNLARTNLSNIDLRFARLEGANLLMSILARSILDRARLDGAALYQANAREAVLTHARLDYASLEGALMEEVDLSGATLRFSFLYGAHLEGATLFGCDLTRCNLSFANLSGASIRSVRGFRPEFTGAILNNSWIDSVNINDFHGISEEQLSRTWSWGDVDLPKLWTRPVNWFQTGDSKSDYLRRWMIARRESLLQRLQSVSPE